MTVTMMSRRSKTNPVAGQAEELPCLLGLPIYIYTTTTGAFHAGNGSVAGGCWDDHS